MKKSKQIFHTMNKRVRNICLVGKCIALKTSHKLTGLDIFQTVTYLKILNLPWISFQKQNIDLLREIYRIYKHHRQIRGSRPLNALANFIARFRYVYSRNGRISVFSTVILSIPLPMFLLISLIVFTKNLRISPFYFFSY